MIGAFCPTQTEGKDCVQHPIPKQSSWLSGSFEGLQLACSVLCGKIHPTHEATTPIFEYFSPETTF